MEARTSRGFTGLTKTPQAASVGRCVGAEGAEQLAWAMLSARALGSSGVERAWAVGLQCGAAAASPRRHDDQTTCSAILLIGAMERV
jgi:hypothetical protein